MNGTFKVRLMWVAAGNGYSTRYPHSRTLLRVPVYLWVAYIES